MREKQQRTPIKSEHELSNNTSKELELKSSLLFRVQRTGTASERQKQNLQKAQIFPTEGKRFQLPSPFFFSISA